MLCMGLALGGCASDLLRSGAYHALHDYRCMEEAGTPRCDPGRMSFREYEALREEVGP